MKAKKVQSSVADVNTVDEVDLEARKVIQVSPSKYEGEELEKVLDTKFADITGVVYGTPKTAEALNLPKKSRIQTNSGSIRVGNKVYTDYKENITFDTEFETSQTVTITGADEEGVAKISYIKSGKKMPLRIRKN